MSAGDWKDMVYAVQKGNMALVKYHIGNGVDPNYEHPELLTTPLIEAISNEKIEITEYLLQNGADPKLESGFEKQSPLRAAICTKNQDLINLLKIHVPNSRLPLLQNIISKLKL